MYTDTKAVLNIYWQCLAVFVLSVALLVSSAHAETQMAPEKLAVVWQDSNAVLLLDLPKSLCAPEFRGDSENEVRTCAASSALSAGTRVRLVDHWRGAGRLFVKAQHRIENFIYTSWLESAGPQSFSRDGDKPMFLPELDALPLLDSRLMGRWNIQHWKLPYDEPLTSGYMEVNERLGPNSYSGNVQLAADFSKNQKGRPRYAGAERIGTMVIDQPVAISVNGHVMTVESKMARKLDANRVHMLLSYDGEILEGYASSSKREARDWTDLPEILLRKSAPK